VLGDQLFASVPQVGNFFYIGLKHRRGFAIIAAGAFGRCS